MREGRVRHLVRPRSRQADGRQEVSSHLREQASEQGRKVALIPSECIALTFNTPYQYFATMLCSRIKFEMQFWRQLNIIFENKYVVKKTIPKYKYAI